MIICPTISKIRAAVSSARGLGMSVGLVPTMGALHEGHLSLIEAARRDCDFVVVTIFVNPSQFGPGVDYDCYPRTEETDLAACEKCNADAVFIPTVAEIYPQPGLATVTVSELGEGLCGASRPGHFDGVCTVVTKLFNIVQAGRAYFGMKDFQQAAIIKRMASDLNFPIEIVLCPIVREADGLAMSSRNTRLSPAERTEAAVLSSALKAGAKTLAQPSANPTTALAEMKLIIENNAPLGKIDYIAAVNPDTLQNATENDNQILLAIAVNFHNARLIDNMLVSR